MVKSGRAKKLGYPQESSLRSSSGDSQRGLGNQFARNPHCVQAAEIGLENPTTQTPPAKIRPENPNSSRSTHPSESKLGWLKILSRPVTNLPLGSKSAGRKAVYFGPEVFKRDFGADGRVHSREQGDVEMRQGFIYRVHAVDFGFGQYLAPPDFWGFILGGQDGSNRARKHMSN